MWMRFGFCNGSERTEPAYLSTLKMIRCFKFLLRTLSKATAVLIKLPRKRLNHRYFQTKRRGKEDSTTT